MPFFKFSKRKVCYFRLNTDLNIEKLCSTSMNVIGEYLKADISFFFSRIGENFLKHLNPYFALFFQWRLPFYFNWFSRDSIELNWFAVNVIIWIFSVSGLSLDSNHNLMQWTQSVLVERSRIKSLHKKICTSMLNVMIFIKRITINRLLESPLAYFWLL